MKSSVVYLVAGVLAFMAISTVVQGHNGENHPPSPAPSGEKPSPKPPVVVGTTPIRADYKTARKAYPWCKTAVTTSYALGPKVTTKTTADGQKEYVFTMTEDYGGCLDYYKRRGRKDNGMCTSPFYSFMMAISEECHEAVHIVNTVKLLMQEDKPGANESAMYCHSHKGHDTGVPLLKFLAKPTYLEPKTTKPYVKRSFTFTMHVMPREEDQMRCADINFLCGGDRCMVALSDEEYDVCPAYAAVIV